MSWNLEEAVTYYRGQGAPGDQNAVINLLREIQQENGGSIPGFMVTRAAELYGIKEGFLLAFVKRLPRLRLSDSHLLELCGGPNCSKRAALAAFVEKTWGAKPKGFSVKYVPCMRLCAMGPNIRWDGKVYHKADEALLRELISAINK